MKKFKQLKQQLNEDAYMDGGALGQWPTPNSTRSAFSDFGVHRVEYNEQLKRIQAFVHAFTSREYLEPRAALSLLRVKLNLAGFDFNFDKKTPINTDTPIVFKLTRFGGTFGKSLTTPHDEFETTDGFEDILNGDQLALNVMIKNNPSGLYKLDIQIDRQGKNQETQNNTIKID
jgi:hypothetical protein